MALDFPANPVNGQVYDNFYYDATMETWRAQGSGLALNTFVNPTISNATMSNSTLTGNTVLPSTTSIGNVSSTEISYVDGLTSSAQTQLTTNATNITNLTNQVNQYINWIPITPAATNHYIGGTANIQLTLNPSSIPSNARYLLCNIYVTASSSDHENFSFTRSNVGNHKNWVDTRGANPDGQFGSVAQDSCVLTYFGESDGFSSNYGIWYSSQTLPVTGRQTWLNNYGNSGSNAYVYFVVRAYSL